MTSIQGFILFLACLVCLFSICAIGDEPVACGPAQYHDRKENRCLPCGENQYQDSPSHNLPTCKLCSSPARGRHEVIRQPCTKVSDTVLGCEEGWYKFYPNEGDSRFDCHPCRNCKDEGEFEKQSCHNDLNAICADQLDDIKGKSTVPTTSKPTNSGPDSTTPNIGSVPKSPPCARGQYLDRKEQLCRSCGENQYQDLSNHNLLTCKPCSSPTRGRHEVERQPCTKVSDTVLECEKGWYKFYPNEGDSRFDCHPCRNCKDEGKFEKQPCHNDLDAICSDQPVTDGDGNGKEANPKTPRPTDIGPDSGTSKKGTQRTGVGPMTHPTNSGTKPFCELCKNVCDDVKHDDCTILSSVVIAIFFILTVILLVVIVWRERSWGRKEKEWRLKQEPSKPLMGSHDDDMTHDTH